MFKMKKIYIAFAMTVVVCFAIGLSPTDSFAQKDSKKVRLRQQTRSNDPGKNVYVITLAKNVSYFQAINVEDPVTGKPAEGKRKLEAECKQNEPPNLVDLVFSKGNSARIIMPCREYDGTVFVFSTIFSY